MPLPDKDKIKENERHIGETLNELGMRRSVPDPDGHRESMAAYINPYINWRISHDNAIKEPPYKGFAYFQHKIERLPNLYLEISDDPKAVERNLYFLNSVTTEEGMRAFAFRVARDLLSIDLKKLAFSSGDPEEMALEYAKNPRLFELCWVAKDVVNDAADILGEEITNAINDRLELFQNGGLYLDAVRIVGSPFYINHPEISQEVIDKKSELYNRNYFNVPERDNDPAINDFQDYIDEHSFIKMGHSGRSKAFMDAGRKMFEKHDITPYTIIKDKDGNRIEFKEAINRFGKGEELSFSELSGNERTRLENLMTLSPAEKPIQEPTKENRATYDFFSKEGQAAHGRGLQKEYLRLLEVMNKTTRWNIIASPEFRDIRKALKAFGNQESVPDPYSSTRSIENILFLANQYIENKQSRIGRLKPYEQARLDAVKEVKRSLTEKLAILDNEHERARVQHRDAYEEGDVPMHVSTENQRHMYLNDFERKVVQYHDKVSELIGTGDSVGSLARNVCFTLDELREYAVNPDYNKEKVDSIYDPYFRTQLAEMAVLGLIINERNKAKSDDPAEHEIEMQFDRLEENPRQWGKALDAIGNSNTIKRVAAEIMENPAKTADYLSKDGVGKLVSDLSNELSEMKKQYEAQQKKKEIYEIKEVPEEDEKEEIKEEVKAKEPAVKSLI